MDSQKDFQKVFFVIKNNKYLMKIQTYTNKNKISNM